MPSLSWGSTASTEDAGASSLKTTTAGAALAAASTDASSVAMVTTPSADVSIGCELGVDSGDAETDDDD